MKKTIIFYLILLFVLLFIILGCCLVSQITLEKIDDQIKHFDEVFERSKK